MANNPYKNKVIFDGNTLIDLTSDTVTPSVLMEGYTAHDASGQPITGTATGGGVLIEDTIDSHGGTIRTITTTNQITIGQKSITQNGTYTASDDDYDGYSQVTVNVPADENFVVTFYQTNNEWSPDKTYAEIAAAYGAGKNIVTEIDNPLNLDLNAIYGYYFDGAGHRPYFHAYIFEEASGTYGVGAYLYTDYTLDVQEYEDRVKQVLYSSASADALAADVRAGKYFVNANGMQVGSATTRTASDLTASGATVTVPAGIYDSQVTKSVASGSAGTPTASKGTVSNHSVTVTPSVTNSTGYINGGTKTGTGVTVTASELVSGSQTITQNGTVNVTNLASVDVQIPFVTYYTGSTDPASSLGSDGDIYLKVVN